ncbi:hypothetical protein ABEX25_04360 [Paenibacillus thiaminolyticus]|uniref:hypothetical protein n=1 Tax=Paenibacillus thiaminolyticus TaxID=49283 RepID=UPI003D278A06
MTARRTHSFANKLLFDGRIAGLLIRNAVPHRRGIRFGRSLPCGSRAPPDGDGILKRPDDDPLAASFRQLSGASRQPSLAGHSGSPF